MFSHLVSCETRVLKKKKKEFCAQINLANCPFYSCLPTHNAPWLRKPLEFLFVVFLFLTSNRILGIYTFGVNFIY